jgi:hypothetical protein
MAHPKRVGLCSEGKPPQAVRQASGKLGSSSCVLCGCARDGGW